MKCWLFEVKDRINQKTAPPSDVHSPVACGLLDKSYPNPASYSKSFLQYIELFLQLICSRC